MPCTVFTMAMEVDGVDAGDTTALQLLFNTGFGSSSPPLSLWGNMTNIQSWEGIQVVNSKVISLSVDSHSSVTLPTELGLLVHLTSLRFQSNTFSPSQAIPSELGRLTALQILQFDSVSSSNLGGAIPSQVGSLSSLQQLIIHNQLVSSTIPSDLGRLLNLTVLNLGYNDLSGSIPSTLSQLSQLSVLSIASNDIQGSLPVPFVSRSIENGGNMVINCLYTLMEDQLCYRQVSYVLTLLVGPGPFDGTADSISWIAEESGTSNTTPAAALVDHSIVATISPNSTIIASVTTDDVETLAAGVFVLSGNDTLALVSGSVVKDGGLGYNITAPSIIGINSTRLQVSSSFSPG